jgi:hypothetical protein
MAAKTALAAADEEPPEGGGGGGGGAGRRGGACVRVSETVRAGAGAAGAWGAVAATAGAATADAAGRGQRRCGTEYISFPALDATARAGYVIWKFAAERRLALPLPAITAAAVSTRIHPTTLPL